MDRKLITIGMSIYDDVYKHIKRRAHDNERSISAEMRILLDAALGAELDQQLETLRAMNRIENLVKGSRSHTVV